MSPRIALIGLLPLLLAAAPAAAAQVRIAVAANFTLPAEQIAAAFEAVTGHEVRLSFGSTGALYAQITQGAPFAVFLAADDERPIRAIEEGLAMPGTAFTYAIGKVAVFSPAIDMSAGAAALAAGGFSHIALADPETAPYGAAAMEVLAALGLAEAASPKLVVGQNVAQALQFIDSGNAEIGFVSLSQVEDRPDTQVWRVPQNLYTPIRQDAVLLSVGDGDEAALAFLEFLEGAGAHAIVERFGYDVPR